MNRRYHLLATAGLLFLSLAIIRSNVRSQESVEPARSFVRLVRATDLDELGIGRAFGISYSPADGAFLFIEDDFGPPSGPSAVTFKALSELDEVVDSVPLPLTAAEATNAVFDPQGNRFLLLDSAGGDMIEIGANALGRPSSRLIRRHGVGHLGLRKPRGQVVDPDRGHLYILDEAGPSLVRVDLNAADDLGRAPSLRIGLSASGLADAVGMALDPTSGNIHIFDPTDQTLHELSVMGRPIAVRDLSGMGIAEPQGMLFAPTADLTDEPSNLSLYFLDGAAGQSATTAEGSGTSAGSGQLLELSFQSARTPAMATLTASLVQTINTYQFSPPSTDSAGVIYLPDSRDLLMSDSEVNETSFFTGVNLFQITLTGTLSATMSTMSYSDEPTGITINPANRHLFISDDTSREIYEVNPGADGDYDTPDDIISTAFKTRDIGFDDPEGVTYDSLGNRILIADGKSAEVLIISPGINGIFDGAPPTGDDTAVTIDTAVHGINDPEGIAFNDENGHLYVVGKPATTVAEMTIGGDLVQTIDISAANASKPAGLAYGPRSNNLSERSIYVAERGDGSTSVKDGKIYEMGLPTTGPVPPTAVDDDAATDQATLVTIDVAANDYDLNGNLVVTTTNTDCGDCSTPGNGQLQNNGDGTFDYTPNPAFIGVDTFVYEICDSGGLCSTATVTITVISPNAPPVANDDGATTAEDNSTTINVALNDSDPEGNLDPSTADTTCAGCSNPASGTLQNNNDGTFDYMPNQDFFGSDAFVYEICDTASLCDTATVAITVTAVPDVPIAEDDLFSATEGISLTLNVALNDSDPDGDLDLTTTNTSCGGCSATTDGELVNYGDGTFLYTPDPGFLGTDGFSYQICDASALCDTAVVTISVNEVQIIYVSSASDGNVGGVVFSDEDILAYDTATGSWSIHFDGSDVGLAAGGADVDAFHLNSDGSILLSISAASTIPDVGSVDDSDIVRFVPTSLGETTAGAFEWYFDGSDVELRSNGEDVDAIGFTSDGRLLVSVTGGFSAGSVTGVDEDLYAFSATMLGGTTAGSWAMYFDGSDVGLADSNSEEINAAWLNADDDIYLAARGAFSVAGVSGDGADIFVCQSSSTGANTGCTFSPFWDGSAFGFGGELIDGLTVASRVDIYNVSVTTVGSGSVTLDPPGHSYEDGTVVTMTAVPANADWVFSGWGGDLGGTTNPETLTMDGNKSVTATFTLKQYTLYLAIIGKSSVTLDPPRTGHTTPG